MAKNKGDFTGKFLSFIAWLTGVIVSLAVAFSMMTGGALGTDFPLWLGGAPIADLFGWIVVVTTLLGVILAIVKSLD